MIECMHADTDLLTVTPLQQEAEVLLPGQTGLGRELVCWEIRQGELQALAGKNKTSFGGGGPHLHNLPDGIYR